MWERVGGAHLVTIRIEKGFKVNDVRMGDESHDLQFTVLHVGEMSMLDALCEIEEERRGVGDGSRIGRLRGIKERRVHALNLLSCKTFLMAMSQTGFESSRSFAWKTIPKEPLPMTLQLV